MSSELEARIAAEIAGLADALWTRLYGKVEEIAREAVTTELRQAWRGGRLDARYISYFLYTLAAPADSHGKTQTSQQRFPDGHTLDTYAAVTAVAAPTVAPTLTHSAGSTSLPAGTYALAYCWDTPQGQTLLSPAATVVIAAGDTIHVTVPSLPAGAVGFSVYQILTVPDPGYSPALYS